MTIMLESETEVIREASDILMKNLPPSKYARFWAIWQAGHGDYIQWRDETFGDRTLDELIEAVRLFEETPGEG
jgi:hypothetical protein